MGYNLKNERKSGRKVPEHGSGKKREAGFISQEREEREDFSIT